MSFDQDKPSKRQTFSPLSKKIYYQGYFDGACFLYSVANAFRCLTGKDVEQAKWDKAMKLVPFTQDFMRTKGGTARYCSDLIDDTMRKLLAEFSGNANLSFAISRLKTKRLSSLVKNINPSTIVLFAIAGGKHNLDHWLCAVSCTAKPLTIRLACSSPHVDGDNDNYHVRPDDQFEGRHYNWELSNLKDFSIQQGACYSITVSEKLD